MNCYVICDNDSTEFVVIGTEQQAKDKLEELKTQCFGRCIRNSGQTQGAIDFLRHNWHVHDCRYELLTPNGEAVQLKSLD